MISFDFSGHVAVVTGAGGGFGGEIASMILAAGGSVIMIDVKPEPDHLPGGAEQRMYARGDLTDAKFVKDTIDAGAERFGRIDSLSNVAGVLWFDKDTTLLEIDFDIWDRVFETNIKTMMYTARAAVPHMKRSGGGLHGALFHRAMSARRSRSPGCLFHVEGGRGRFVTLVGNAIGKRWNSLKCDLPRTFRNANAGAMGYGRKN